MDSESHVYILGAGFSVPLGGPLFTQLLTLELQPYVSSLALRDFDSPISKLHLDPTNKNHRKLDGLLHKEYNAEQLLELID